MMHSFATVDWQNRRVYLSIMSPSTLSELLKLSEAERLQLAHDLWDSIPPMSDALTVTEAQVEEWERRVAEHKADPSSAIPWKEVRARLRERYGA